MNPTDLGQVWPTPDEFCELADHRRVIPVATAVVADTLTPVAIYHHLAQHRPGTFLLESADVDGAWSRYSIVGVRSAFTLTADDDLGAAWIGEPPAGVRRDGPVLDVLADVLAALATPKVDHLPPFTGGFVGLAGYGTIRALESIDCTTDDPLGIPTVLASFTTDLAVMDHRTGTVWLIANAVNHNGTSAGAMGAYDDAVARVNRMRRDLTEPGSPPPPLNPGSSDTDALAGENQAYQDTVRTVKQAIVDGEVFQAVLSQRFEVTCAADAFAVYRCLRRSNPSPYMYFLRCATATGERFDVVGASPEALVRDIGGVVESHPIAGTRPRGSTRSEDSALVAELVDDAKERAEHIMLVDLARNDLARVCEPGSVAVDEFMVVQQFSHVSHLVSTVTGRRRAGRTPVDALRATFPAGTLSGAPKHRAMQLIEELEPHQRGLYGGIVGYFDVSGDMDVAIAIRTAVIADGVAYVQAGAGIVADSDPAAEDAECRAKARAVVRAIAAASAEAAGTPERRP